jgi:hypothetical protein
MALQTLDPSKVLTGADGELHFGTVSGTTVGAKVPLAHVNEFTVSGNFQNTDYHPIGQYEVFAIPTAITYSLTITEAVILDLPGSNALIDRLQELIEQGCPLGFQFTGHIYQPCAQGAARISRSSIHFAHCIPDGNIDLLQIRPGDIVTRRWSFRANSKPTFPKAA